MPDPVSPSPVAVPAPFLKSRTVGVLAVLIGAALTRLLGRYIPSELAHLLADALTADVMAGAALVVAPLAMYLRARVGKSLIPAGKVPPLAILAFLAVGCASTWPATCAQDLDGRIGCRCRLAVVVDHRVSKRIGVECDGQALPLTISYTTIEAPQ